MVLSMGERRHFLMTTRKRHRGPSVRDCRTCSRKCDPDWAFPRVATLASELSAGRHHGATNSGGKTGLFREVCILERSMNESLTSCQTLARCWNSAARTTCPDGRHPATANICPYVSSGHTRIPQVVGSMMKKKETKANRVKLMTIIFASNDFFESPGRNSALDQLVCVMNTYRSMTLCSALNSSDRHSYDRPASQEPFSPSGNVEGKVGYQFGC